MSTQDILAELPRLSVEERALISKVLHDLAAGGQESVAPSAGPARRVGLHAGAWEAAADFDAPLPEGFWLGEDA